MKIIWNKVTWYSKLLAVIVFVGTIWLGFYFNSEFKKVSDIKPVEVQSQSDIDTKDWKTYRNEKYGFEFKYPANLEFNAEVSNKPQAEYIVWTSDDRGYKIQFLIGANIKLTPAKDMGNTDFPGMIWHKTLWNPGTSEQNYVYENSNIQVLVSPDYEILFEQILPTFKFIH